jgi:amino acid transporter
VSSTERGPTPTRLSVRQAAFIGVGGTVGAGIFSLLSPAGEVAGAAVWLSFLLAGGVVLLQGYSFAKLGARYPSAAGLLEYVARGWGDSHIAGIVAWLLFATNAIITSMVAVTFGSYASSAVANGGTVLTNSFGVAVIVVMTLVNISGSRAVARVQTVIVVVVIGILALFATVTLTEMQPHLLAFSGYPPIKDIVAGVAVVIFAFLGFAIVTFTAKDLAEPERQLPRAVFLALGIATVLYIVVALGVFGTLTVDEVVASRGTALADAAEPVLGRAGYWLMTVTALFATAGATNAGLYPVSGICEQMAERGQFPPALGRRYRGRVSAGLLLTALIAVVLTVGFELTAIVSMGSAIALIIWAVVGVGHLRVRTETGANTALLVAALVTAMTMLVVFALTTLVSEPATVATITGMVVASVAIDLTWKRTRARSLLRVTGPANAAGAPPGSDGE